MTRSIMNSILVVAGLVSIVAVAHDAVAGCHGKCHSGNGFGVRQRSVGVFNQDAELRAFLLLRQNPLLAAQHADLAARLNLKYANSLKTNELITINGAIAGGQQITARQPAQAAAAPAGAAIPVAGAAAGTPAAAGTTPAAAGTTPAGAGTPAAPAAAGTPGPAPESLPSPATPSTETVSDIPSDLPAGQPPASETANVVPSELQPLLGLWRNVTKKSDGSEQVTEIELAANGNAKVTVEAGLLGKQTIEGQFAVEDGNFNVKKGEDTITLGKVEKAEKDEVILKRGDLAFNFTRP